METKHAVKSTGVWGSIVAIAAPLLPILLPLVGVKALEDQQAVLNAIGAIGGLVALYGRLRADKKLTL